MFYLPHDTQNNNKPLFLDIWGNLPRFHGMLPLGFEHGFVGLARCVKTCWVLRLSLFARELAHVLRELLCDEIPNFISRT